MLHGEILYDKIFLESFGFTYPPFAGVVFAFFSFLSENALIILWQVGMIGLLAAVIAMVIHERGYRLTPLTLVVCALLPVASIGNEAIHGTLFYGQINILLMFLVALDILPARRRLPGVGIGIAAGLKLTPAYMGLVLLFQRRWWAAVVSVATFAVTVVIGYLFVRDANDYWIRAMLDSSRIGTSDNTGSKSVLSVLHRNFDVEGGWVWILCVVVIFAVTCLAPRTAMLRDNRSMAFALTGISSCLISPFSWYHHFVWLVPLGIVLFLEVNEWIRQRVTNVWGKQLAGLGSLIAVIVFHIPFVAYTVWWEMSSRGLDYYSTNIPWMDVLWTGLSFLFLVGYAVFSFIPRRRSSRRCA